MATSWLNEVRVATVGTNITLTGTGTPSLDGVTLAASDRILVKDQSDPSSLRKNSKDWGFSIPCWIGVALISYFRFALRIFTARGNGVYVWASGGTTWARATDFAAGSTSVTPEASVRVSEGRANAHTEWFLSTTATSGVITVGAAGGGSGDNLLFAPKVVNPKSYGCPCDGIHDDRPGWLAMMASIPVGQGAQIDTRRCSSLTTYLSIETCESTVVRVVT